MFYHRSCAPYLGSHGLEVGVIFIVVVDVDRITEIRGGNVRAGIGNRGEVHVNVISELEIGGRIHGHGRSADRRCKTKVIAWANTNEN